MRTIAIAHPGIRLRILGDLRRLKNAPLTTEIRNMYQEFLESDALGKLAVISSYDTYFQVLLIKLLLIRHRDQLQHFTDIELAKEWLEWDTKKE